MEARKARSKQSRKRAQQLDPALASALAGGEQAAAAALLARARMARSRKRSMSTRADRSLQAVQRETLAIPARTRAMLGASASAGTLIAEGDSWFDYPMQDILSVLEDHYLYEVESVAHRGDRVEDMAYADGQFEMFARRLEKLLRANKVPRAILLSGGGNDIAGEEFTILLNHAASSQPALNEDIVRGVVDVRLRDAFAHIFGGLTTIAKGYLDAPIPIIVHGYGHPVPDGRGVMGGWSLLPGPWLRPGFIRKGHASQASNTVVMATLIDRFNAMLETLISLPQFGHVHYVDLRSTLINDAGYKKHWANELHPTKLGFNQVTAQIAAALAKL